MQCSLKNPNTQLLPMERKNICSPGLLNRIQSHHLYQTAHLEDRV